MPKRPTLHLVPRGFLQRLRSQVRAARRGSALLLVMASVTILSLFAALLLARLGLKSVVINRAGSWQESLLAAEAGADIGMAELRRRLTSGEVITTSWKSDEIALSTTTASSHRQSTRVVIDAPVRLRDSLGNQWYRIQSMGITEAPGSNSPGDDGRDSRLRKGLNLVFLRSKFYDWLSANYAAEFPPRPADSPQPLDTPRATRLIEVIAKPRMPFQTALTSDGVINMNGKNVRTDSFNSSLPGTRAAADGGYDENAADRYYSSNPEPTKAFYSQDPSVNNKGSVATNGQVIQAGNANIYGDGLTNNGSAQVGAQGNIYGTTRTDFYQELLPIQAPTTGYVSVSSATINNNLTLTAGTSTAPLRYGFAGVDLNGKVLTLAKPAGSTGGNIELFITGDISLSGNGGAIEIEDGVNATIYVGGNVDVGGDGFVNDNQRAASLQFYGLTPPDGSNRSFKLHGNGAFKGVVYAPAYNIEMKGGGSNGVAYGSFIGKSALMTGNSKIIYDEALAKVGRPTDYSIASWYEDSE